MIYLQNNTSSQVVNVPKNGISTSGDLVFSAKSTIDLETEISLEVTDTNTSNLYYRFAVTLPTGIPNGEYEYTLEDDDNVLSSGLLVIGNQSSPSQYEKEITYEQYTY